MQEPSFGHDLEDRLRRLNEIGAALSLERDLDTLLDRILLEAVASRAPTQAHYTCCRVTSSPSRSPRMTRSSCSVAAPTDP